MGTGTSSNAVMRQPRTVPSSAARPMSDLTEAQLSSEQLVDGVLLKAFRDEVRLPNGQTSVR